VSAAPHSAGTTPVSIRQDDLIQSVADALQYISYYHPVDYIRNLAAAYERQQSPARRTAIAPIPAHRRSSPESPIPPMATPPSAPTAPPIRGQPKPCTALLSCGGMIKLFKPFKYQVSLFRGDAHAGIRHCKFCFDAALPAFGTAHRQCYISTVGEFDSIAQQVYQYLPQPLGISFYKIWHTRIGCKKKLQFLFLRKWCKHQFYFMHHFLQPEYFFLHHQVTGFYF